MNDAIAWCGFIGAWFLFAGPVYQAAIELREEAFAAEEMERVLTRVPLERMSGWWWLLPPVAYVMARRLSKRREDAFIHEMTETQQRQFLSYKTKAHGWLIVAVGGFLLALKETDELREHYGWPAGVFWALVVAGAGLAVLNTAFRTARIRGILEAIDGTTAMSDNR